MPNCSGLMVWEGCSQCPKSHMGREIVSAPLGNPRAAGGVERGRKKESKKQCPVLVEKKPEGKYFLLIFA